MLLLLLLLLLACSDPYAEGEALVEADGIHVTVALQDLEQVLVAGHALRDGETAVLPLSLARPGYQSFRLEAEGLDRHSSATVHVSAEQILGAACDGEGSGSVTGSAIEGLHVTGCAVVDGRIHVPMKLPEGVTVAMEHAEVVDGVLQVDLMPAFEDARVSTGSSFSPRVVGVERTLTLTFEDGETWSEEVDLHDRGDTLSSWVAGAPATFVREGAEAGDPELALYPTGRHWWVEGRGETFADVDLLVKVVEEGEPFDAGRCAYTVQYAAGFAVKAIGVPVTYAAYDRTGAEVARKRFVPRGCPGNLSIDEGQTEVRIVPGQHDVRTWVKTLLD